MNKIAVFTNRNSEVCDFFDAERFLIFERDADRWRLVNVAVFKKIGLFAPPLTIKNTKALLPLVNGCDAIAGGTMASVSVSVFESAGLNVFEIWSIGDDMFDGIIEYLRDTDAEMVMEDAVIAESLCY
jgi:hypothetical protein